MLSSKIATKTLALNFIINQFRGLFVVSMSSKITMVTKEAALSGMMDKNNV